ncbi:S1 RNA-binding domain-containing protein [Lentzea albida]|uniref:Small subunit ribosomal protein S1 n=1 Tax=Lentzea albida TaxID=65499 RepID=A0A1H9H8A9_9PSEU|nr:S1 RNA-binding domain-containing protein [Lentzea albida]SEQ58565.1 small subunit ribosomal protein S1 [Lentzea albida]
MSERVSPHEQWQEMVREYPELHAFLDGLRPGQVLSGTVAAVERFGVFVALDDGPPHPFFPGVGFVTIPEVSWHHDAVVEVGQRVRGRFFIYDTWHMEARLSLKALQPDPLPVFADAVTSGQELPGVVTEVVPIGVFVRVGDGIEGLLHEKDLPSPPPQVGDQVAVVVHVDRERRRVTLTSGGG